MAVGLVVTVALLAGCHLPAAPDVTPTPSQQDLIDQGMAQMGMEAAEYSATLTAVAQSPLPLPTPEPTTPPTEFPTAEPTAELLSPEPTSEQAAAPPATVAGETTYTVQPGDNLYRIAMRFGMRFETLATYNNIVNPHRIYVGQVIRIPGGTTPPLTPTPGGETSYTVQPGDNLFRIAMRFNLSYVYLASYNGISNPHRIYVGQTLRIPAAP